MRHLQNKIWSLAVVVLLIMVVIWVSLTYYNEKMQDQYNQILERYLVMNELSVMSQELVTALNTYTLHPSKENLEKVQQYKHQVNDRTLEMNAYKHVDNEAELTNYTHLVNSVVELTDQSINFQLSGETDTAKLALSEALHVSDYVSELRLSVIDAESSSYDRFYREMIERSEALTELGIWLLLLIILLLLCFTYWFSQRITKPLESLTYSAKQLSKGDFDAQIITNSKDETAILASTFEQMRININHLFKEIRQKAKLEKELQQSRYLLKESQLLSLQRQINPHFLFNTLNTLSKKAYMEGSMETSDLLVSIADLLRYNLKHMDQPTALREEVYVLKQYVDIQKARFTDRLTFHCDIEETCLDVQIPGLTLQPIIENAIIHAVEPNEDGGVITFRVTHNEQRVAIEIEDNGPGMTSEKVDELLDSNTQTVSERSTGIGFKNVVQRLRIFNGEHDIVHINSQLGIGTTVTLYISKDRGEKKDD
ncbi:histidine kinase [Pontibacillus halophilus JSM 076056 = DSM 19796]|uniref:histidine kinase n=1 Tax=Pontibacillus halophilus JSM 076056 = DSM 19796 TaxID=1385510 RepID=A0A0A5GKB3_9BACI|nr:histidine kinase [Pontibacillus halophilus]KGX93726.1 histidine kinase [Pontibacillus halophilus JSM 076056 = DSM 19796]